MGREDVTLRSGSPVTLRSVSSVTHRSRERDASVGVTLRSRDASVETRDASVGILARFGFRQRECFSLLARLALYVFQVQLAKRLAPPSGRVFRNCKQSQI